MILFGGVKRDGRRFCNDTCYQQGYLLAIVDQVPEDLMQEHVRQVHQGPCPKCGGEGPVDVHTSHLVLSIFVMTTWKKKPLVCCKSCAVKSNIGNTIVTGAVGWWGVPFGIIFTPIVIVRNIVGLISPPDPVVPSPKLVHHVKLGLASQFLASRESESLSVGPPAPVNPEVETGPV
jgi:hypothetical protein